MITSSPAAAPPAACWPTGSLPMAATACCCSKPVARMTGSGSTFRSATFTASAIRAPTGVTAPKPSPASTAVPSSMRAGACSAVRRRSTPCFICAARRAITTNGRASPATTAGPGAMCCRCSKKAKTTGPALPSCTAQAVNGASSSSASVGKSSMPFATPPAKPASPRLMTSTPVTTQAVRASKSTSAAA